MLSIVTINRNNAEGLRKTIASLRSQSSQQFQWVFIDGASTDASVALGAEFARAQDVCISESDLGIYNAMNKGILHATKDFILFLNSGDILVDTKAITSIEDSISKDWDLVLFGFSVRNRIRMPKPIWSRFWALPTSHQAIAYKRSLLLENSFFESYQFAADFEHFLRIMVKPLKIRLVKRLLVCNEPYGSDANLDRVLGEYRTALVLNGYPGWLAFFIYRLKRFYLGLVL
jgi:glycosyltransferase involved in cell wall biosynthesis